MARKSRKNLEDVQTQEIKRPVYNVAAYIRLSSVDKKQKGDSIETQQSIINSFISENENLTLTEVYIDNGISGQTFERPAFKQMITDMENGKINCCITKDLSRLGRNAIDTGFYVEKFFPMNNIRFIAITDNYDSEDSSSGGIMLSLKNMINEAYALDIGRKIRATVQMQIRNGEHVGRIPPYGYLKSKDDFHKLVPDKYAATIVTKIFNMYACGDSVNTIVKWLNETNISTPMRHLYDQEINPIKYNKSNKHWSITSIYRILKNRIYCGDMVQGKYKRQNNSTKLLPKDEWIIIENTHEAIISKELFFKVENLLENKEEKKPKYLEPKTENIFLRKVYCGHCGLTLKRRRTSKINYKFLCNTFSVYHKDDCDRIDIVEPKLKKVIIKLLHNLENQWAYIYEPQSIKNTNLNKDKLKQTKADLDKNSNFLKGLYESLILGDITDDEYKTMKASYETKIATLKNEEKILQEDIYSNMIENDTISKAGVYVKAIKTVDDLNKEHIEKLVEKILIYKDGSLSVKFKFSDEVYKVSGGECNE